MGSLNLKFATRKFELDTKRRYFTYSLEIALSE